MNKRNSYIAAAALAIAGMAGMASWLALEADDGVEQPAVVSTLGQAGVVETEALLPAPHTDSRELDTPQAEPLQPMTPQPRLVERPIIAAVPARRERTSSAPIDSRPAAASRTEIETAPVREREPIEPAEPIEPIEPALLEVRVPAGTVMGIRLATSVSSDTAEVEDRVEATVTRDVIAGGRVAIPAGTTLLGSVNEVTRGGKFKERARIGLRFHTLVLADGSRESVRVDPIVREGDSPTRESVAKIGIGAAGGAIIGGIAGGKKGAILGGLAGAGAGTAAVAAGDRSIAALASGSPLSVRLDAPVTLTIERNRP